MSDEPPTPPSELPIDVVDTLEDCSPERPRQITRYADELPEFREREARVAEEDDEDEIKVQPDDFLEDVPLKATTATTTGSGEMAIG